MIHDTTSDCFRTRDGRHDSDPTMAMDWMLEIAAALAMTPPTAAVAATASSACFSCFSEMPTRPVQTSVRRYRCAARDSTTSSSGTKSFEYPTYTRSTCWSEPGSMCADVDCAMYIWWSAMGVPLATSCSRTHDPMSFSVLPHNVPVQCDEDLDAVRTAVVRAALGHNDGFAPHKLCVGHRRGQWGTRRNGFTSVLHRGTGGLRRCRAMRVRLVVPRHCGHVATGRKTCRRITVCIGYRQCERRFGGQWL
eukprot:PhM_4_TR3068/c1_g4_i1/m.49728